MTSEPWRTPQTQADVQELADKLNRGEITDDQFFAAIERRAERLAIRRPR